ncbi:PucR family transcriptional regulator [Microbacterium betulae]|uniref:PucR family transcriptional regulator n=1 Tax=Microbacterium betulae TaxID=2981139 RepID=A0AA97FJ69_9MICO|nr:PucR family transcriptional regulator [Microbacterium sp. AB]WOF23674.1 PucR family transcriptional regulator [Microbacterium sp. AB]
MSPPAPSAPTLRALLSRADLRLRLAPGARDTSALTRPIRWVHSSDLADPTPFIAEEMVLLTTGTQFSGDDPVPYDAYVQRLADRGVVALGFGTEVVRAGIPAPLADACGARALPLFEVPYRTPFIAVARAVAEALAAGAYARRTWALSAQRAVALAALRQDGMGSALTELSRQLGAWVGLYDSAGAIVRAASRLGADADEQVGREAATMLARGASAAGVVRVGERAFTLQTLGPGGSLRGVLAVGAEALDEEARSVVTAVVAMTGFALEQNESLVRTRGTLRAGVVRALLTGDTALAGEIADAAWGGLPSDPVVVAATDGAPAALSAFLELHAEREQERFFFGEEPTGGLAMAMPADAADALGHLVERFGVRIGVSEPAPLGSFGAALEEARIARGRGEAVTRFADVASAGVLSTLSDDAASVARSVLAPVVRYDEAHGTAVLDSIRAWLLHDTRYDDAARALGVHRHTVRTRIRLAERLLERDLRSFAARAEIWVALLAAREGARPSGSS